MRPFAFLLLIPVLVSQDEIQVSATLNRSTARVGETVLLTVTLRAAGLRSPEIADPELDGFEILATNDRSSFRLSPSLGALREFSREYTLRVLNAGELTIPPLRATVDGVLYESEALKLEVEREGASFDIPGELGPRPEEEVAVRLWVEPETAFVGQQVTMTVGAFFDPLIRSRLQRQPEYRPPEVQGFWTADLPGTQRPERRVVGRREYFVQIYRRALFPLSPGEARIPPAAVIYEVRRGLIYAPETFEVESSPVSVMIRPLPTEGRPDDFAGAIGRFAAHVSFDRSDLRAGEAVNLILELRGSGNLNSLTRPELPEIPGVRVYEGGEDAEVLLQGVEFAGHKRFSWVLVPERPGQYVLPELRIPYFDPVSAAYAIARSEPVSLLVAAAPAAPVGGAPRSGVAIRFIKPQAGGQPLNLHRKPWFWLGQAIPLALLLGFVAFGRIRTRVVQPVRQRPKRRARMLRELRPLTVSGDVEFFGKLRTAIMEWLAWRLHLPELPMQGVVQVQHALEDAGVPPPVALEVIALLERSGRLRYAPDPPGESTAREMLSKAEKLLAQVDREAVSERRLRTAPNTRARQALSIALLVGLPTTGLAQASGSAETQQPGRLFQQGVAAYERGEHDQSVDLFRQTLAMRPHDPGVLYNLGNAHYELSQRGKAVAYWVRALQVAPRDADARYNLRLVVGDDPVLGSALPPLPLSKGELAILLSVLWTVGCVALIARLRWRKAYLSFAGYALMLLAVLCALLVLYPRADYAIISDAGAPLRAGPVRQSEILASPPPGTGYRVEERRGDWIRVSRGSESEGWVERSQVELID